MSQGSLTIADGSGLSVLAAINAALARLATKASGTARPSDIAAGEFWIETDNPGTGVWSMWLYDGASDILFATINSSTHAIAYTSAGFDALLGSTKGMLAKRGASAWAGLAVGGALYGLHVNAAGDDLEYRRNGWEKLVDDTVVTGSSVATIDITGIPASVKALQIHFDLTPVTNGVSLYSRLSQSGSFVTSSNYYYQYHYSGSANDDASTGSASQALASLTGPILAYNAASGTTVGGVSGVVEIPNVQQAAFPKALSRVFLSHTSNGHLYTVRGGHALCVNGAVDGYRFYFSSGNIAVGSRVSVLALRG